MFSRAAGREGRCRQLSLACVGSTRSVPAMLGVPVLTGVCYPRLHCSGSRLLYMEWALHCVRFQFSGIPQKRRLGWACLVGAAQAARSLTDALTSGATHIIPLRSQPVSTRWPGAPCVCSRELASRCGPPGRCRPSRISGSLWLETGRCLQFGRGCLLGC